jgi:CheY-like chemotaxis protein
VRDPPRILIVDDNENNRAIIAARLGAQGYSTFEACDGADALEAVRREPPDLILLDVTMPKIDPISESARWRGMSRRSCPAPAHPSKTLLLFSTSIFMIGCAGPQADSCSAASYSSLAHVVVGRTHFGFEFLHVVCGTI